MRQRDAEGALQALRLFVRRTTPRPAGTAEAMPPDTRAPTLPVFQCNPFRHKMQVDISPKSPCQPGAERHGIVISSRWVLNYPRIMV